MIPAVGLFAASLGVASPADASVRTHAISRLQVTGTVSLGLTTNVFANGFAETPGGDVYYSGGPNVYLVAGNSAPALVVTAGGPVLALAANKTELFVQVGLKVTAYSRSDQSIIRQWTLTSPVKPITSAGLYAVGSTLWSWTDWATDASGFEYAKISRMSTSSPVVHTVEKQAYPGDMSADSAGLYFEAQHGSHGVLGHAKPSGSVSFRATQQVDAPLALSGGRVDLLAAGTHDFIKSYRATNLSLISSKKVSQNDRNIAGTSAGLLVLAQTCTQVSCVHATVSKLSVSTGAASGTCSVPNAVILLPGPAAGVIELKGSSMYLVRIAA
jgi:hypothetical protein